MNSRSHLFDIAVEARQVEEAIARYLTSLKYLLVFNYIIFCTLLYSSQYLPHRTFSSIIWEIHLSG